MFNEPGSVQFQYDVVVVNAFNKKPAATQKPQALRLEPPPTAAPTELPSDRPDSDAERDFLSFDEPEGPTEVWQMQLPGCMHVGVKARRSLDEACLSLGQAWAQDLQ